jgi:hypothetical protein
MELAQDRVQLRDFIRIVFVDYISALHFLILWHWFSIRSGCTATEDYGHVRVVWAILFRS